MGIKSTSTLTRKQAEDLLIKFLTNSDLSGKDILDVVSCHVTKRKHVIKTVVTGVSNEVLGDLLDEFTDSIFDNYLVEESDTGWWTEDV